MNRSWAKLHQEWSYYRQEDTMSYLLGHQFYTHSGYEPNDSGLSIEAGHRRYMGGYFANDRRL